MAGVFAGCASEDVDQHDVEQHEAQAADLKNENAQDEDAQEENVQEVGQECRFCRGTGYNAETLALFDSFHGASGWCHDLVQDEVDMLAEAGRLFEFTHDYILDSDALWVWKEPRVRVDVEVVNLWSYIGFGHDHLNQRICVEVRAMREGCYGLCPRCGGEGEVFH